MTTKNKTRKKNKELTWENDPYNDGKNAPDPFHTPATLKVTFDGKGINDTNQYASRIATLQPEYLHLGRYIATAINSHEGLVNALQAVQWFLWHKQHSSGVSERRIKNRVFGGTNE